MSISRLFLAVLVFDRPVVGLKRIDHVVGNQPNEEMVGVAEW